MRLKNVERRILQGIHDRGNVTTLDTMSGVDQRLFIATLYELWGAGLLEAEVLSLSTRFTLTLRGLDALENAS